MKKLVYQESGSIAVFVIVDGGCSVCGEIKQAIAGINGKGASFIFYICRDCALQIAAIIKRKGPLPNQDIYGVDESVPAPGTF